ncbi:hypothetical protein FACS1894189_6520 [Planctomycetales bacterium]|nr:hypothetical protein FACS1894189_6520 [Planctomycetales bacterium]
MKKSNEIQNVKELLEWIAAHSNFGVMDEGENYFYVQCPRDTSVSVRFENEDDINEIIFKTIERFEDFDADDEFTELWSHEFAEHNHFTPSRFLTMLQSDEKDLHELALELRQGLQ